MPPISATLWPAVSQLLDQALDLPSDERKTWLERLTREQPDLGTAVQALLAAHARRETGDFLDRGPALATGADGFFGDASDALNEGETIGPYRLLRALGSGGMAVVWLAERSDGGLARQVALKIPQRFVWRQGLAERFARERDILARLEHPHIARLYDAGVSAADGPGAGLPYLVLEYVQGTHLTAYCDAHRLNTAQRLALAMQVLEAVQYAHARLVIHRDLKPANILVTEEGQVRLLDFGVAKLLAGDDGAERTQLTQVAGRAFTPDYASPEQVRGETLGTATDVYSLGVVLYELLCGERPYRLKHASMAQLEQAIVDVEPEAASSRATDAAAAMRGTTARKLQRELRGELDTILFKALRKKPEQRYGTVAELAEDLRRQRDGEPVLARPESRVYRLSKFIVRNRLAVGASCAVVVALVAASGVSLWQARVAQRQATRAVAVQGFLTDIFRANSDTHNDPVKARSTTARELLDIGARRIDRNFTADPEGRADVLVLLGDMYYELGLDPQAAEFYRRRVEALKQAFGARDARVAVALANYAKQLEGQDREPEQMRALAEANAILDGNGDFDSEQRAQLLTVMASAYELSGTKALAYAEQAADLYRRRYGQSPDFAMVLKQVGVARWRLDDNRGAEAAFREALALLERQPQSSVAEVITIVLTLADVQTRQGKIADAERSYRLALEKTLARNGAQHADTLHAKLWLGWFLYRTSREAEGRGLLNAAYAQWQQGSYTPHVGRAAKSHRLQLFLAEGRFDAAEAIADDLVGEYRQVAGGKTALLVAVLRLQAEQRLGQGRYAQAEQAVDEAWSILTRDLLAEQGRKVANSVVLVRARIALAQGHADAALRGLQDIKPRPPETSLPLRLDEIRAEAVRAQAQLRAGQGAEALQTAQSATDALVRSNLRDYYRWVEAETLLPLGQALQHAGQTIAACSALRRSVALRSATDNPHNPYLAEAEAALAACLLDQGDAAEAARWVSGAQARLAAATSVPGHVAAAVRRVSERLPAPAAAGKPRPAAAPAPDKAVR